MSTREQLIKVRLDMLALADELKNSAKACRIAGVSRFHFHKIKQAYGTYGTEGKVRRSPGCQTGRRLPLCQRVILMRK